MRIDTLLTFRQDQVLLANSFIGIKFKLLNEYILFSQENFMIDVQQTNIAYDEIKPITKVNKNGVQFFQTRRKKEINFIKVDKNISPKLCKDGGVEIDSDWLITEQKDVNIFCHFKCDTNQNNISKTEKEKLKRLLFEN